MWTETELAYLAGIIDGEGCLSMGKGQRKASINCQLYIGNTDARVITWVHERFGGSVALRPAQKSTHKPLWRWLVGGEHLAAILTAVIPYLVIKREQAALLLEYRSTVIAAKSGIRSQSTPTDVIAKRLQLKSRMLHLNRRGAV